MKRRFHTWLMSLCLYLCAVAPVLAGPYEHSVAAVKRGDYASALNLLRPLAEQGDAEGQFGLGFMYFSGLGVQKDFTEAVMWYRRAADQGSANAQFNLGGMYARGQGVYRDLAEALKWYRAGDYPNFCVRGVVQSRPPLGPRL